MKPVDKARDLMDKLYPHAFHPSPYFNTSDNGGHTKACALIVVNEFLNFQENLIITEGSIAYKYWQDVKEELEKL